VGSTEFQPPIFPLLAAVFGAMVALMPRLDRAGTAARDRCAQRVLFCLSYALLGVLQAALGLDHAPWWRWAAVALFLAAVGFLILAASTRT
jgi:peptidoglycan/LPS O-acetylase OafA/YrhL